VWQFLLEFLLDYVHFRPTFSLQWLLSVIIQNVHLKHSQHWTTTNIPWKLVLCIWKMPLKILTGSFMDVCKTANRSLLADSTVCFRVYRQWKNVHIDVSWRLTPSVDTESLLNTKLRQHDFHCHLSGTVSTASWVENVCTCLWIANRLLWEEHGVQIIRVLFFVKYTL